MRRFLQGCALLIGVITLCSWMEVSYGWPPMSDRAFELIMAFGAGVGATIGAHFNREKAERRADNRERDWGDKGAPVVILITSAGGFAVMAGIVTGAAWEICRWLWFAVSQGTWKPGLPYYLPDYL